MMLVDDFSALLKRRMGLDSGSIGKAAVERAVRHRMGVAGVADERDYLRQAQSSADEMQQLIEAVIVPETWFFRYPESQAAMAALARERLFAAGAGNRRLRVLSLPCSSGEEPYSIVMALLDAGVPAERFQVDAVDISVRMVDFARRAVYGRNSFRGGGLAYRDRYFSETADGHQLAARVAGRVRFRQGNLFAPDLLEGAAPYDFVFCRNLLIYFDAATQARAVQVLLRFAREDGALFVGPAETGLLTSRGLPPVSIARSFAFGTRALPRPAATPAAPLPALGGWSLPRRPPLQPAPASPWRAAARAEPPGEQEAQASLRQVASLADQGRVDEAMAQCRLHIDAHGASAEALYLQGLLLDAAGEALPAQAAYRKALYLDPAHREALLHLAALVAAEGDHEGARRLQARAARKEARRE